MHSHAGVRDSPAEAALHLAMRQEDCSPGLLPHIRVCFAKELIVQAWQGW